MLRLKRPRGVLATAVASLVALAATTPASAAGEWQSLQLSKSGLEAGDTLMERVWFDRILSETKQAIAAKTELPYAPGKFTVLKTGQVAPSSFVSASFQEGGATYTVSLMLQRGSQCEDGPNSLSATINYGRCPLRLTKQTSNGDLTTTQFNRACFVTPDPANPDITRARMEGGVITVETVNHSRVVDGCSLQLRTN